jgi:dTDP-4-dehydrorhamnose reductase
MSESVPSNDSRPVVVLGTTGMIGSTVSKYLAETQSKVIEVNRSHFAIAARNELINFDVLNDDVSWLVSQIPSNSTVLNLIGLIRHKIHENDQQSIEDAKIVNTTFSQKLVNESKKQGIKVIQIATDCIFSGKTGMYSEKSPADPVDVYGKTKYEGEIHSSNLMTIRVSVIGNEIKGYFELMDWVMKQKPNAEVRGFRNHLWNGITSLHFAIVDAVIHKNLFASGTFHIVPENLVSKLELVTMIASISGRNDLKILETLDSESVNRSLSTAFPHFNSMIWQSAGYESPPTIRSMLEEYFDWSRLRG